LAQSSNKTPFEIASDDASEGRAGKLYHRIIKGNKQDYTDTFSTLADLRQHQWDAHKCKLACPSADCHFSFRLERDLLRHIPACNSTTEKKMTPFRYEEDPRKFYRTHFSDGLALQDHKRAIHKRKYPCTENRCDRVLDSRHKRNSHVACAILSRSSRRSPSQSGNVNISITTRSGSAPSGRRMTFRLTIGMFTVIRGLVPQSPAEYRSTSCAQGMSTTRHVPSQGHTKRQRGIAFRIRARLSGNFQLLRSWRRENTRPHLYTFIRVRY
jgi:hypothetical protein